jgi:hypothetical protein
MADFGEVKGTVQKPDDAVKRQADSGYLRTLDSNWRPRPHPRPADPHVEHVRHTALETIRSVHAGGIKVLDGFEGQIRTARNVGELEAVVTCMMIVARLHSVE